MARSVANINQYIVDTLVIRLATVGININPVTWSKKNMLRQICYTVAICQALMEQLQDYYSQQIDEKVSKAAAASAKWVQDKMFKFQYSSTDPQAIALINTVPTYPIVNPALRIITACSVTTDISNAVAIKVAKGSPLEALSTDERNSAQGYINTIGVIGIEYTVVSLNPDKLFIDADVFYQGQYASIISSSVITAVKQYLESLSLTNFNGAIKISDLYGVIRNVIGVTDVVLKNVRGRADSDNFAAGIDLVLNKTIIQKEFVTIAGYISEEDTATKTFVDTITFIPQ